MWVMVRPLLGGFRAFRTRIASLSQWLVPMTKATSFVFLTQLDVLMCALPISLFLSIVSLA